MTRLLSEQRGLLVNFGSVFAVGFSRDGTVLTSASKVVGDLMLRQWNPSTGEPIGTPMMNGASAATLNKNGIVATGGEGGTERLWNPATGQPIAALTGQNGPVYAAAFNRDGTILATTDRRTIQLWNPATGQPVGSPLTGHTGNMYGVALSGDGTLLASASADGTVRLWNPALHRDPYAALCTAVGPFTLGEWHKYAPNEPQPVICEPR